MTVFRQNITIDGEQYGQFIARLRGLGAKDPWASAAAKAPAPARPAPSPIPGGVPEGGGMGPFTKSVVNALGDPQKQYEETVRVWGREYEQEVNRVLEKIHTKRSGQAVIRAIVRRPGNLAIVPWLFSGTPDSPNARTSASSAVAATQKGRLLRDDEGVVQKPPRRGTGRGSDSEIQYLPYRCAGEVEGAGQQPAGEKPAPGTLEDEILLHELIHAMEFLTGKSVSRAVPFQPLYDTREELFAIVITNIYRSEWAGRSQIRAHHHGYVASGIDSQQFLRAGMNRHHLRQLRRRYPILFSDLHALDVPFNPIRLMNDV